MLPTPLPTHSPLRNPDFEHEKSPSRGGAWMDLTGDLLLVGAVVPALLKASA
jgi:hypothetical protein